MKKKELQNLRGSGRGAWLTYITAFLVMAIGVSGCDMFKDFIEEDKVIDPKFPLIEMPPGYKVQKVASGLERPTSVAWDDEGNMYVVEAGNDFLPEKDTPMRIMQLSKDGNKKEVVNLSRAGIKPAIVGLVWHDGWFYFTHRADDETGGVSRANLQGNVELVFKGIIDSQAEHQINDIRVGPDGMMYVAVGMAGNAAVMDASVGPFVKRNPEVKAMPCQDIVLVGRNYKTGDFRTEDTSDSVLTGAYVPFGETTYPGQVIKGVSLCGGSILKFDPTNAMATMTTHAWGFRNLIGLSWDSKGTMYAAENGYDVRGARPVNDDIDASLIVHEGMWYGIPDFSAGRDPLTNSKYVAPDSLQPMSFIGETPVGRELGFVIDHAASGLTPPDPSVVLSRHEINSSPSMIDVAPRSWGNWADQAFIAEWGDLAPPTNPLRGDRPSGYQVVRVDPANGKLTPFVSNMGGGPASEQGMTGKGLERPFDVQFGPDGAMYIVDFGVMTIDMSQAPPYVYKEGTGVIWKITKGNKEGK